MKKKIVIFIILILLSVPGIFARRGGPQRGNGDSCFIATATYGSGNEWQVQALRDYRDDVLLQHWYGRAFVDMYYAFSPPVADFIRDKEYLKKPIKNILNIMVEKTKNEKQQD